MSGDFEIVTDALSDHAGKLDGLVSRLRTALDAARQVTMNDDAYGIICRPFAALLNPVEQRGADAVQGAVEAMEATATGVRNTVTTYQEVEEANRTLFRIDGVAGEQPPGGPTRGSSRRAGPVHRGHRRPRLGHGYRHRRVGDGRLPRCRRW